MKLLLIRDHEPLASQIQNDLARAFSSPLELTECLSSDFNENSNLLLQQDAILLSATCIDTAQETASVISEYEQCTPPVIAVIDVDTASNTDELNAEGIDDILLVSELTPTLIRRSLSGAIQTNLLRISSEHANQKTLKLLSRLSHEFNGHIRILRAASAILQEDITTRTPLTTAEKQWFDITNERIASIESSISDFSFLLGLFHRSISNERVDLNDIIRGYSTSQLRLNGNRIHLKSTQLPMVCGDKELLNVLLSKIIQNSTVYNESDEVHIDITYRSTRHSLEILIKDNGIGIESCYLESIFDPFIRLHHDTEYAGSGLGLTIAKTIVELHNGTARVDSEPGNGSLFTLTLPISRIQR